MNNITSVTIVLQDNTIWSAEGSAFIQLTVPATPEIIDVPLDTPIEIHNVADLPAPDAPTVPETPTTA